MIPNKHSLLHHQTEQAKRNPSNDAYTQLTEQLATKTAECEKLTIELDESRKIILEKQQEVTRVFDQKNKEMIDLLEALLRPLGMGYQVSPLDYGMQNKRTVPNLAGMVASGIAQLAEKNNLSQSIIEEQDEQIAWFRELIQNVLGVKKPKVDTTKAEGEVPPPLKTRRS